MTDEGGYRSQRALERERERDGERSRPKTIRFRSTPQVWVGAAIVIAGAALLLDNLGVIESSRQILRFWPVILIAVGVNDVLRARSGGRAYGGALLTAFGVLFLLNNLDVVRFSVWDLWPLFLILFGVHLLMQGRSASVGNGENADAPRFDDFAFLGAVKRYVTSSAFEGGSASALMGGIDLNLRQAEMAGSRAAIHVFSVMGGVNIRVPDDWAIESQVMAIMGGVDDKTRPPTDAAKTLVVHGTVFMGGVEIND